MMSTDATPASAEDVSNPAVGIVMGSDSDWPTMRAAAEVLTELGIDSSAEVISAHRMPEDMVDWAKSAAQRGVRVIIAGAGGAAHLPGMIASLTSLPVIGVPVPLTYLDGMDSLLSIVQMPGGVPVATVSIGGAKNAGLLAARILGTGGGEEAAGIRQRLDDYRTELRQVALDKGRALKNRAPEGGVTPQAQN